MNSNRFSSRSGVSTTGGNTVLNALASGGRGMQRTTSEASVTGGRANGGVAPVVQAANALINAVNAENNNAASSVGSFSPGRSVASNLGNMNQNSDRMSVASFNSGIGSSVNASVSNLVSVRSGNNNNVSNNNNNVMNVLRNIQRQNMLAAQNIDNLNNAELAALENFAMSPGTPSHKNKKARFF